MIRDYPDVVPTPLSPAPSSASWTPSSSTTSSPTSSVTNLPLPVPASPLTPATGPLPPPPRHPPVGLQTTYTPYVPRARRGRATATPTTATSTVSSKGTHMPLVTSSSHGGVTARHGLPASPSTPTPPDGSARHDAGPSAALLDKVRALDSLPRLGALRTLDLKGNDLRVSGESALRCISFLNDILVGHHISCASPEAKSDTEASEPEREQAGC